MEKHKKLLALSLLTLASVANGASTKPSILLVHGAFADGSSWSKGIPILGRDGYDVTAVPIPLTALAGDIGTTRGGTAPPSLPCRSRSLHRQTTSRRPGV